MNWSGMREIAVSCHTKRLIPDVGFTFYNLLTTVLALNSFIARYPSHAASKWLDSSEEHRGDIDNLHSNDGDFHHGFNSGVLAATRMLKECADVEDLQSDVSFFSRIHGCTYNQV